MPIRLEVGPRDLEKKQTVMARRDTGEKIDVPETEITPTVVELLEKIQVRPCAFPLSVSRDRTKTVSVNVNRLSPLSSR